MTEKIRSYRDLDVWQKAMAITEQCYKLTAGFPRDEIYGLSAQIRRAAVSIAANIAEGYGREQTGAFIQFLRISQGSNRELETHLLIAGRVKMTTDEQTRPLLDECDQLSRMLRSLIRALEAKLENRS